MRPRLSLPKKIAYALLATTLFFAACEALLALLHFKPVHAHRDPFVEFESSSPLFVQQTQNEGAAVLETAANKRAYFNVQRFPRHKPPGTIRVFCLGGSTTYGRPYDDRTSFAGWLRELLPAATDGQQWEVINAGGISYASYRVAALMEELCEYSPDVFVVYTGHNEFLEERTYRDVRRQPDMQRLTNVLGRTRTYSLVESWLRRQPSRPVDRDLLPGEVDTILDHAAGPGSYHRDERLRTKVFEHFEFNLCRKADIARAAGAEILLVSPAANLKDLSPFKSEHGAGLGPAERDKWSKLFAEAQRHERDGAWSGALVALEKASQIDDRHADLHFRRGRALFAQARFGDARTAFLRAIDEDICPLRAPSEISAIIERTAVARRIPLIDFDAIVQSDCLHHFGHAAPGTEYFVDHVHPTVSANRLLAVAVVEAMIQKRIAKPGPLWRKRAVEVASQHVESRVDVSLQIRALTNLAQVLSWAGKQAEAGPVAMEAVRLRTQAGLPGDVESSFYAGVHLAMTGSNEQAIELLRQVVQGAPSHAAARWRLAQLLYDQQRYDEAERHFSEAVRLNSTDAESHRMLGLLALKSLKHDQALAHFDRAHQLTPRDAALHINTAFTLQQLARNREAIQWYRSAIGLDTDATRAHREVARLLMNEGRFAEAVEHLEEVVRLDPESEDARGQLRSARQRFQDAHGQ